MFATYLSCRQLKEIQNKTNSENRHLVFLIFKKEQENDGVGDISTLFQRHCQTNDLNHWFDNVFGIKTKYHRLRRFLVLSRISGIQDVYFRNLLYFVMAIIEGKSMAPLLYDLTCK